MLLRNKVFGSLAIIVICLTNGWHLPPIQAFAWLSMAIENSDSDNVTEALSSAMEGKEICGICQYVIEQKTNADDQVLERGPYVATCCTERGRAFDSPSSGVETSPPTDFCYGRY